MKEGAGKELSRPLVSIITVAYNAQAELAAVLTSVLAIKNSDIEVIVVDGGSKDGTVEYLEDHTADIDFWISEPDQGIYDAMNKAIAHATGTYLLHLNAGDKLVSVPYDELRIGREDNIDVLAFRVALDGGRFFQPTYGSGLIFNNTLHHQGTFFRRASFPKYDDQYRIFADFDVNQRMKKTQASARVYDKVVAYHAVDGVSNQNTPKAVKEFFEVIQKNHGLKAVPIAWLFCKWRGLKVRLERII